MLNFRTLKFNNFLLKHLLEFEQLFYFIYLFFLLFRAAPIAYGGFQARGWIRAVAASLHYSHSNVGSKPRLQATPQLTATPDP